MVNYFNRKFLLKILDFLKKGISPKNLALTIVIGFAIGTFPILGIATIMSAFIAVIFRLNMVVIQLSHYVVYPLQLILFVPFIKIGGALFNTPPFPYTANEVLLMVQTDFMLTLKELWIANMMGILTWTLLIIPISIIMFYFLNYKLRKLKLSLIKQSRS
jgi:uncharacterized protein (DUF2062 family)